MHLLRRTLLAATVVATAGWTQEAIPAPLAGQWSQLREQSSWSLDLGGDGNAKAPQRRGAYPVGNGFVFACAGLGARANTLQGITGPRYHTDAAAVATGPFGEQTLELLVGGEVADLARQRLRRVRAAAIVITEDADASGLALRTTTFAEPGATHLTRVVEVHNGSDDERRSVALRLTTQPPLPSVIDELMLRSNGDTGIRTAHVRMSEARRDGDRLLAMIGDLDAGETWRGVVTISMHAGDSPPPGWAPVKPNIDAASESVRKTLLWWNEKLAPTMSFDTDHRKLRDLVEDWKVLMLVQRCAHTGAIVPMLGHRLADVRQFIGAMLLLLRFNLWSEARDLLTWLQRATRALGRVPERARLDLDTSAAAAVTDWESVALPDGDVASWVVLLHFWYWRTTRDTALIEEHAPLLEICVKRQRRSADDLLGFSGSEPFLLPRAAATTRLSIDEDAAHGRRVFSLASGIVWMMAMQGYGEMLDGIDRDHHPERWAGDGPAQRPSTAWVRRSIELMRRIEQQYWLAEDGYFAPALSAIDRSPHRWPVAEVNLLPLWVGWTFPSGEHSRDNLQQSLARLWLKDGRIGSTANSGDATGHAQGMLVAALAERDAAELPQAFEALLAMAEPAGEWAGRHDADGRPATTDRSSPLAGGVNVDALLYAIDGMRRATIANWDNADLRAELRLPDGAHYATMKNVRKDGRTLNVFLREVHRSLDKDELEPNERAAPEARRDPTAVHRRLHFRIELLTATPPAGRVDAAVNAMNTMFVRHLKHEQPIDESEFWRAPTERFFPATPARPPALRRSPPAPAAVLVLTRRNAAVELYATADTVLFDTGLPVDARALADLLFEPDGARRYRTVLLDWDFDGADPLWQGEQWSALRQRFVDAGGEILTPGLATAWEVAGDPLPSPIHAPTGLLALADRGAATVVRTTLEAAAPSEAVLRLGSACGYVALLNGERVLQHDGARLPLPDTDARVVQLRAGPNLLEITLATDGAPAVYARITDSRGLPINR